MNKDWRKFCTTLEDFEALLSANAIEELFPDENWLGDPENAFLSAGIKAACHCISLAGINSAIEILAQLSLPQSCRPILRFLAASHTSCGS